MPPPLLCTGCASDLSLAQPTYSEKPPLPPFTHPCGHAVCAACQRTRRRLVQYCIMCDSAQDVFASPSVTRTGAGGRGTATASTLVTAAAGPAQAVLPTYEAVGVGSSAMEGRAGEFVLGGDSDDEEDGGVVGESEGEGVAEDPPAYVDSARDTALPTAADTERQAEQTQVHYIQPEETLLGLSMRYKVDVSPRALVADRPALSAPKLQLMIHQTARRATSSAASTSCPLQPFPRPHPSSTHSRSSSSRPQPPPSLPRPPTHPSRSAAGSSSGGSRSTRVAPSGPSPGPTFSPCLTGAMGRRPSCAPTGTRGGTPSRSRCARGANWRRP